MAIHITSGIIRAAIHHDVGHSFYLFCLNPMAGRILGKPARKSLDEVTERVDMVIVFRPSEEVAPFVRAAAARPERPIVWLPEGVRDEAAAAEARAAGVTIVQDLCIYRVHRAMGGTLRKAARTR